MKGLEIVIPTYNRRDYLIDNLRGLISYITEMKAKGIVSISVSDNCSNDGTAEAVRNLIHETDVSIRLFVQEENLGSVNNFIFLIDNSKADNLMLLGDDDYISKEYLGKVINCVLKNDNITAIVPNCYNTAYWKYRTPIGKNKLYDFPQSLKIVGLATQMSGLVFQRDGLSRELNRLKINNSYLTVFFVGFSAKKGKTLHITENPIRVTIPEKRPWNYSQDMFINDLCENFVALDVNYVNRVFYEMYFVSANSISYISSGINKFIKIYKAVLGGNSITAITKILFPLYIGIGIIRGILRRTRFVLSRDKGRYIYSRETE